MLMLSRITTITSQKTSSLILHSLKCSMTISYEESEKTPIHQESNVIKVKQTNQMKKKENEDTLAQLKKPKLPLKRVPFGTEKPKQPPRPLLLFQCDLWATSRHIGPTGIKDSAAKWKSLPIQEKQKYIDKFKALWAHYEKKLSDWKAKMIAEGHGDIVEPSIQKQMLLNGMPKQPPNAFLIFVLEYRASKQNQMNATWLEAAVEWRILPDHVKQKYIDQYRANLVEYKAKIRDWKAKMITDGRGDFERKIQQQQILKPKRPAAPNLLFYSEYCKKNPQFSAGIDRVKVAAAEWKMLPENEKQKYYNQYKANWTDYKKQLLASQAKMISGCHGDFVETQIPKKSLSVVSDKPKRPSGPNLLFYRDYWTRNSHQLARLPEAVKAAAAQWNILPENEKQKYVNQYNTINADYKKKLSDWQARMISEGRGDLVGTAKQKHLLSAISGKPKRPFYPYHLFYRDFRMRNRHMTCADVFKSAAAEWKSLPDNDKQQYFDLFSTSWADYKKKKNDWEAKMIGEEEVNQLTRYKRRQLSIINNKPRRPLSPNILFYRDYWASKHPQFEHSKPTEMTAAAASEWKRLPHLEKQKYIDQFKAEFTVYRSKLLEWEAKMIADNRGNIVQLLRPSHHNSKKNLSRDELADKYGMPKPPPSTLWNLLITEKSSGSRSGEELKTPPLFYKEIAALWKSMSEKQKRKYDVRLKKEWSAYETNLQKWKEKMLADGHNDILLKLSRTYKRIHAPAQNDITSETEKNVANAE